MVANAWRNGSLRLFVKALTSRAGLAVWENAANGFGRISCVGGIGSTDWKYSCVIPPTARRAWDGIGERKLTGEDGAVMTVVPIHC